MTDDSVAPSEVRQRLRSGISFPADLTLEELIRDWTLSETDLAQVRICRGEDPSRRFALQLCTLRRYGRFLETYDDPPLQIVNHLGVQLRLPPVLLVAPPRPNTESEHRSRLLVYLGLQELDASARQKLALWIEEQMKAGLVPHWIAAQAEEVVRAWGCVLPRASVFSRLVYAYCRRAETTVLAGIAEQVPAQSRKKVDELLRVPEGDQRSLLFHLREYPPRGTPETIQAYLQHYQTAVRTAWNVTNLRGVSQSLVTHLSDTAKRHDAWYLRRLPETKRYALMACFLVEVRKTLLDHLVEMHDQHITSLLGECRREAEDRQRERWLQAREAQDLVFDSMEWMLASDQPNTNVFAALLARVSVEQLRQSCREYRDGRRLEEQGYLSVFREKLARQVRPYFREFLRLPFLAEQSAASLQEALQQAYFYFRDGKLPSKAVPLSFVPASLRRHLFDCEGKLVPEVWEIALAVGVRDALRARELYLSGSRRYVSFWKMVYSDEQWKTERQKTGNSAGSGASCDAFLHRLQQELDYYADATETGLVDNPYARMQAGRLRLHKDPSEPEPPRVKQLRQAIESHLPRIRIERLLLEVDALCGFTRPLRPPQGSMPAWDNANSALLAAVIAHGTNLGIVAMSQSAEGVTLEQLRHVTQWCLRPETLGRANRVLVDWHHQQALSSVWGTGIRSSSDGQRFGLQETSKISSYYPRYFGYYGPAVTLYTHVSDQYSTYAEQAISCTVRESVYVLAGLLGNDTLLRPRVHHTDTHGYTDQIFGLFRLLGLSFQPRLAGIRKQRLWKLRKDRHYGSLEPLFQASVPGELIREQWDNLQRVVASLQSRQAVPEAIIQRLASAHSADRLAKALTAIGRLEKSIFLLRWLRDADLRQEVGQQLNRGEHRHSLGRWLFFANQGEFRAGDYEEIMNKASCLSLLSNAILLWNTVQITRIVKQMEDSGQVVRREDLGHVSPLLRSHIIPNGMYDLSPLHTVAPA
jgi:TnpA family transposase